MWALLAPLNLLPPFHPIPPAFSQVQPPLVAILQVKVGTSDYFDFQDFPAFTGVLRKPKHKIIINSICKYAPSN